jgi:microcystin-dependent protein
MAQPYTGEVRVFAFTFAPAGWAACNGQLLSINQNPELFQLIGTTYGGDGVNSFALPDLRGRTALHEGSASLGQTGGAEAVTLTLGQMASHTHEVMGKAGRRNSASPNGASLVPGDMYGAAAPDGAMGAGAVTSVGGDQPHDNMQPYLAVNFCIALAGTFPSQG